MAHLSINIHLLNYFFPAQSFSILHAFEYFILPEPLRFLGEKLFNMIFYVDQRVKAFSIREFCNDLNRWKSEDTMSDEYGGIRSIPSKLQQPLSNGQRIWSRYIVLIKHDALPIRQFWTFSVQLLSLIRLIASNTFPNLSSGCLVEAHNTGFLSNSTRAWLSSVENRLLGRLKVIHSAFPNFFSAQHYYK